MYSSMDRPYAMPVFVGLPWTSRSKDPSTFFMKRAPSRREILTGWIGSVALGGEEALGGALKNSARSGWSLDLFVPVESESDPESVSEVSGQSPSDPEEL